MGSGQWRCLYGWPEARGPAELNRLIMSLSALLNNLQVQPSIYVTYNGDFFDWPFIGGSGVLWRGC